MNPVLKEMQQILAPYSLLIKLIGILLIVAPFGLLVLEYQDYLQMNAFFEYLSMFSIAMGLIYLQLHSRFFGAAADHDSTD